MSRRAVLVRVGGRVQGVWFRGWTEARARALGLDGWVRNDPDGTVCALIAGPEAAVAEMLAALHEGPELARVTQVTAGAAADPGPVGFELRR